MTYTPGVMQARLNRDMIRFDDVYETLQEKLQSDEYHNLRIKKENITTDPFMDQLKYVYIDVGSGRFPFKYKTSLEISFLWGNWKVNAEDDLGKKLTEDIMRELLE